jgi:hypothetical protein
VETPLERVGRIGTQAGRLVGLLCGDLILSRLLRERRDGNQ